MMMNPASSGPELCYLSNTINGLVNEEDDEMKKTVDEKVIGWMKKAFTNANLDMKTKSTEKDLICILLDIILYQDAGMVNSAFTLLARYFQQKNNIITYAQQVQLLQDEQEVGILKKVTAELRIMKKSAEDCEFWMGCVEASEDCEEPLVASRQFITKLEMLSELCIYNPDRIIDTDEKKGGDDEEENEFLNLSELRQEWDNEDPIVTDDDEKNDHKNQTLLRNLNSHNVAIIIIK